MSTTIYTGHEIVGHTLESFLAEVQRLRPEIEAVAHKCHQIFVVNSAVSAYDEEYLHNGGKSPLKDFIRMAYRQLLERQDNVRRTQERDPFIDTTLEVSVFPHEGRLFAMLFSDNQQLTKFWTAQPWWRDYSYWNNSDGPDDCSEQEWLNRKLTWDAIFPDARPPAQRGYSLTVVGATAHLTAYDAHSLAPFMSTLDSRAEQLADTLSYSTYVGAVTDNLDLRSPAARKRSLPLIKERLLAQEVLDSHLTIAKLQGKA